MKKINCPRHDYTKTYIDNEDNLATKRYNACDWDLSNYTETGSEEGFRQRVHEELMLLQGEIVGNEDYGIFWEWFIQNAGLMNSDITEFKTEYTTQLISQIEKALSNIYNFIELEDASVEVKKEQKKLLIKLRIKYFSTSEEQQVLEEEMNI